MFHSLNIFMIPLIFKTILALNRKNKIGYQYNTHKNQTKNIKPFHILPPQIIL